MVANHGRTIEKDGFLWGMTSNGGKHNQGVIFTLSTTDSNYRLVHHLDAENGGHPRNGLLYHQGQFWGTTSRGGRGNKGVIFKLQADGTGFQKIHDFGRSGGRRARERASFQ
ncbi:choice-of-anchor tandem repeat GloVer-containing protein [Okeania hirsuta]